ncbi:hypothetical protein GCM10017771_96330 [Streptomyces capitiformicae]|uniref:Uncharacterized protein n=1 Tax=Streptomyces capitiformicae TaxID=2014920 RepID=A0A918ZVK3_9ACTN|nr:hypothetical protein GCM10017771_96330 [Streptomyces capitiformicae]
MSGTSDTRPDASSERVHSDRDPAVGLLAQRTAAPAGDADRHPVVPGNDVSSTAQASGPSRGTDRSATCRRTGIGSQMDRFTNCCRFCSLPSGSR